MTKQSKINGWASFGAEMLVNQAKALEIRGKNKNGRKEIREGQSWVSGAEPEFRSASVREGRPVISDSGWTEEQTIFGHFSWSVCTEQTWRISRSFSWVMIRWRSNGTCWSLGVVSMVAGQRPGSVLGHLLTFGFTSQNHNMGKQEEVRRSSGQSLWFMSRRNLKIFSLFYC